MRKEIKNIVSVIIFLLILQSFSFVNANSKQKNFKESKVIATVGPINITAEEFINGYEYGPAFIRQKANSKERYLDFMINEKLFALKGYEDGIEKTEQFNNIFKEFENDLATEEMFNDIILPKVKISSDEIDTIITQKSIDVEIKWIYSNNKSEITKIYKIIAEHNNFDSLFNAQLSKSVLIDQRSMAKTRFQIGKNNPEIATIIDTLEVGAISSPIKSNDGYYIIKLENFSRNLIHTKSEYNKLKVEAEEAIKLIKMNNYSDKFVDSLLRDKNPIIKRNLFNILEAYLGKYFLDNKIYNSWKLEFKLQSELKKLNISGSEINDLPLVIVKNGEITIKQFLLWYHNRNQYIKLDKSSYKNYSSSLQAVIWRMVRDFTLTELAKQKGYFNKEIVIEQSHWWKDKIAYSMVRDKLAKSIQLNTNEIKNKAKNSNAQKNSDIENEYMRKMYLTLNLLKKKYPIKINNKILKQIKVTTQNDPTEINMYFVKKGGLIPRQPFPTIDFEWGEWE